MQPLPRALHLSDSQVDMSQACGKCPRTVWSKGWLTEDILSSSHVLLNSSCSTMLVSVIALWCACGTMCNYLLITSSLFVLNNTSWPYNNIFTNELSDWVLSRAHIRPWCYTVHDRWCLRPLHWNWAASVDWWLNSAIFILPGLTPPPLKSKFWSCAGASSLSKSWSWPIPATPSTPGYEASLPLINSKFLFSVWLPPVCKQLAGWEQRSASSAYVSPCRKQMRMMVMLSQPTPPIRQSGAKQWSSRHSQIYTSIIIHIHLVRFITNNYNTSAGFILSAILFRINSTTSSLVITSHTPVRAQLQYSSHHTTPTPPTITS